MLQPKEKSVDQYKELIRTKFFGQELERDDPNKPLSR